MQVKNELLDNSSKYWISDQEVTCSTTCYYCAQAVCSIHFVIRLKSNCNLYKKYIYILKVIFCY